MFIITWEYTSMSFCVKVFRVDGTMEAQSCRERMNTTCCTHEHACDTRSPREGTGEGLRLEEEATAKISVAANST